MSELSPSDLQVAVDGELKPSDIDAPRLVLIRKLNTRGEPIGDFAYVAYWASDGDPAEQDRNAEYLARAVNSYAALVECAEALKQLRAAVKSVPEMNHMRFDGIGIRVFNALNAIGEA